LKDVGAPPPDVYTQRKLHQLKVVRFDVKHLVSGVAGLCRYIVCAVPDTVSKTFRLVLRFGNTLFALVLMYPSSRDGQAVDATMHPEPEPGG
jgi:hypothetical protein